MKKLALGLTIILLFATGVFAQSKTKKPIRKITRPTSDIRKVDFKNFRYGGDNLILRNGHQKYGEGEMDYVDLSSVKYVDFDGDGKEEAFVVLDGSTSGSSGSYLDVFVFAYRNGSAQQIWRKTNERSSAILKGRLILFTYPEYVGDDAHCCPSYATTDTYGWKGSGISQISKKRKRLK